MGNVKNDDKWLEAVQTKDWMDLQIRIHKQRQESYKLNDSVKLYIPRDYIALDIGADYIADLLGLDLVEEDKGTNEYYRYHFNYLDMKFLQLSKERLGKYARTDGN